MLYKKIISLKLLRIINLFFILLSLTMWAISFVALYSELAADNLGRWPKFAVYCQDFLLLIFSLIIALKASLNKGNLLITLFLTIISLRFPLQHLTAHSHTFLSNSILFLESVLIGTVFIKSMQSFPGQIIVKDIKNTFPKSKALQMYVKWSIKDYNWVLFPVIIWLLQYLHGFLHGFSDIFIVLTAFLCLFVNYKKSTGSDQNKILWLFWGLLMFTILVLFDTTISFFSDENSGLRRIVSVIASIVVIISFAMSLFFSNAFDTGTLIKRTLADSSIFFVIVIIYNTVEHYFLHWLSHALHLSDVLVSSLLSGILVMVFSPLHHKLMHFMENKIKKHHANPE